MSVQIIRDRRGKPEYVVLPAAVYDALKEQIDDELAGLEAWAEREDDYVPFDPGDYLKNPVAVARLRAGLQQKPLAAAMGVTQAYLSKLERSERVTAQARAKVNEAIKRLKASA